MTYGGQVHNFKFAGFMCNVVTSYGLDGWSVGWHNDRPTPNPREN